MNRLIHVENDEIKADHSIHTVSNTPSLSLSLITIPTSSQASEQGICVLFVQQFNYTYH